ncbi:MAG: hypothetical protein ACLFR1_08730 [Spirochaetia bacterium]
MITYVLKVKHLVPLLVFLFLPVLLFPDQPRTVPEEYAVRLGQMSEPLELHPAIEGALAFSGVSAARIPEYRDRILDYTRELETAVSGIEDDYEKGEAVLEFMHENILSVYSEYQTRVDVILDRGTFNCVSSAVLYLIFMKSQGLNVQGVSTSSHAFCFIPIDGEIVDIETTNIHGFDPGRKQEFTDSFGNTTGYSYVPPGNYSLRTRLEEKQLIGLIFQNRIASLEARNRYAQTIGLAVDRYFLQQDQRSFEDMARTFINYASVLNERGEYAAALEFLSEMQEEYGESSQYNEIIGILTYNLAVELFNSRELGEAQEVLSEGYETGTINEREYRELMTGIVETRIANQINSLPFEEAMEVLNEAIALESISQSRYREYMVYLYGNKSQRIAEEEGFLAAARFLEEGLSLLGQSRQLRQAMEGYYHNYAVEIHNRFGELYNSGQTREARRVLEQGLENVPDSRILQQDLRQIQ